MTGIFCTDGVALEIFELEVTGVTENRKFSGNTESTAAGAATDVSAGLVGGSGAKEVYEYGKKYVVGKKGVPTKPFDKTNGFWD